MLTIADVEFESRLFTGTGKFSNSQVMLEAITASKSQLVTVAMKRIDFKMGFDDLLTPLRQAGVRLLPNTSGARNAKEAVFAAELAREMLGTHWIKLEIHPDPKYLMPDAIETLAAAKILCDKGFIVMPYVHADPVLCRRLEEVGCAAVMPLASPIGSNQGLVTESFLKIIIEQARVPVVIDAGIGAPSQAARAMELGADAVLVNTAIASSASPIVMAECFKEAVQCGRRAFEAGLGRVQTGAVQTSPLTGFLNQ
ncbi:thiazole synthase [Shewanella sp. SW36]|uniref:thiazole synthase n=1 Tax=Shewanella TaxID=22 RepID=UPI0021D95622|nr:MULTISPECIES: thiazole synthase [Shewanella]MCU7975597.1 thiazole synthase [Shewanella sp. SW36]MCU7990986.1 thiazole synthase [Shewanella sp. SW1]MCU8018297.1 thiazole synthase [Shewanella sp. SM72]MCU8051546.1 thiazole synthase [Shewanella sp. SM43]MCU8060906.1 thiazole synthase [Shewanella sp. SM55]